MAKQPVFISKSKYMEGLRCPKLLWYEYNQKSAIPEMDPRTKAVMAEGQNVGLAAQRLFPNGLRIERDWRPEMMSAHSFSALSARRPLFEAGFVFGRAYAIADILIPSENDGWDLIEVKSSSSPKADHYEDVAFQHYVYSGAGIKINRDLLMFLNREYVKRGGLEVEKLFREKDVSEGVKEKLPLIGERIAKLLKIIAQKDPPAIELNPQCTACLLNDLCGNALPIENQLKHEIQKKAILEGAPQINSAIIQGFLDQIKYPVYFLDFETIAPAIPIFDLSSPYEEIPFQYSLHIIKEEGGSPAHLSYLAPGDVDPRPEALCRLQEELGSEGSIVAYNAAYEINCLRRAIAACSEYQPWFEKIKERFVDLWQPFKNFAYYHPAQGNSTSMKSVLPTFAGTNYKGLEIGEGWTARNEYMRIVKSEISGGNERDNIRRALEQYCELDTKGMVEILAALKKAVAISLS